MGYAGFYFKVFRELNRLNYYPARWMLLTIMLTVLAYLFVEWGLVYKLILTLMSVSGGLFIFNKIQQKIKE